MKKILKTLKLCIEDSSLKNINEDDVEWISADDDLDISPTFTDQQIIDNVITPKKIKEENCSEESGNEDNVMRITQFSEWSRLKGFHCLYIYC